MSFHDIQCLRTGYALDEIYSPVPPPSHRQSIASRAFSDQKPGVVRYVQSLTDAKDCRLSLEAVGGVQWWNSEVLQPISGFETQLLHGDFADLLSIIILQMSLSVKFLSCCPMWHVAVAYADWLFLGAAVGFSFAVAVPCKYFVKFSLSICNLPFSC
ncbi:hypothetical protein DAPPUDRAFT_104354 [Daphnia pulex]|uniref:Uncharacterized protein n=1 Tax=Daphnia pulex TaxID=6669 RepID=E9GM02_DAPPU|nr:hypothetical protein DAPPUDRAFT_104354 [Daphnia pulex]|eukprot:EFX79595.1 hypothetical protein DAPPUDRAFT_104354 [Daphnia pulex]